MCYKIAALKNFAKITEKHLCQSLFLNKVAIKKRPQHRCFPKYFLGILRRDFLNEHFWTTATVRNDCVVDLKNCPSRFLTDIIYNQIESL